jgi:hypothetical protein
MPVPKNAPYFIGLLLKSWIRWTTRVASFVPIAKTVAERRVLRMA